MKRLIFWGLILLSGLNSCAKKEVEGEVYNSPSGQYILNVQIGDKEDRENKYEIFFKLLDENGDVLDVVGTRASAIMNYAVFWDTDDTIILHSSDIGVYSWIVTSDDKLAYTLADYKMEKRAEEIFNKKMGI